MSIYEVEHYIGGKRIPSASGKFASIFNPATGEVQGQTHLGTASELDKAVEVARAAFPAWAGEPPLKRARVLFKFCN